jgi:hypothetical protein
MTLPGDLLKSRRAIILAGINPDTGAAVLLEANAQANGLGQIPTTQPIKRAKLAFTAIGAYSAYDRVGALVELPNWSRSAGGGAILLGLRLCASKKSINPVLRVHFYRASNPTLADDNAQWKDLFADDDKRGGYIDMPAMTTAADTTNSDCSRSLHDQYGQPLGYAMTCGTSLTSLWVALEILNPGGTAFDSSPGNTIDVILIWEQL